MWQASSAVLAGVLLVAAVATAMPAPGSPPGANDDYPSGLSGLFGDDGVDADDADDAVMWRERREPHAPSKASLAPASGDGKWTLGLGKRDASARFTPHVSVGVLGNMQQFFDNLKTNLDGLEALPKEERDAVLGKALIMAEQDRTFRPRSTAAYLHALRNHRPSHKLRNFVEDSEIANLRGANNYDPNLLWSGLGKRR